MITHYSAPGKLFLLGEWAILEMGNTGVVAAVNKRVHSEVKPADNISITLSDFNVNDLACVFDGQKLRFAAEEHKDKLKFIKEAIEASLRFINEKGLSPKGFAIRTWNEELQINGKKIGFGSSAAATVAVVASLLAYHDYPAEKEEVYKLATIAHYFAQGKVGSAFDVAASTYGGIFVYRRFDPKWLQEKIDDGIGLPDIVNEKWPGLYIEQMQEFPDFCLAVGWSGESASTTDAINKMQSFKESHASEYNKIMKEISDIAEKFVSAWKKGDSEAAWKCIKQNKLLLRELTGKSGVNIETEKLKLLAEIAEEYGGAGKLSGAGGGDCGIAVSFDKYVLNGIKEKWEENGIKVVDADIDKEGVRRD
ncbi:MAG TPA: phosphomevalonate kinase [archaeon]|nr:phosphomevalonate kinase [archaeon]